jgi:hypothetical protein
MPLAGRAGVFAVLGGLLALGLLGSDPAHAQDPTEVRCKVSVGYASAEEGSIHPSFRGIPGPFKSVRMEQESSYRLHLGEQGSHRLPTGGELHMVPVGVDGSRLQMQIEMPGVVNTRLGLRSGNRMIVGGVPFRDGQLLIQLQPEFDPPAPASQQPAPASQQPARAGQSGTPDAVNTRSPR